MIESPVSREAGSSYSRLIKGLRARANSPNVRLGLGATALLLPAFTAGFLIDAWLPNRDPTLALCRPPLSLSAVARSDDMFPVDSIPSVSSPDKTLGMSPSDYIRALNAALAEFEPALRVGNVRVSLNESSSGLSMPINAEVEVLGIINPEDGSLREISVLIRGKCAAYEDSLARRILIAATRVANPSVSDEEHAAQVIELGARAANSEAVRRQVGARVYAASSGADRLSFSVVQP